MGPTDDWSVPAEERLRQHHRRAQENIVEDPNHQEYMTSLLPHLHIASTSPSGPHPSVTFSYTVQAAHCNPLGNLHGGCAATLFDYCTSMALTLVARPGFWAWWGVSRTLLTTYLRPAGAGEVCTVECEVVHAGRRLAQLRGTLRRVSDGAVLVTCEHGKVNNEAEAGKI